MKLKPCAEPGCPTLTATTRCPVHTRAKDRTIKARTTDRRKVYASPRWRGLRRTVLKDHPWCQHPGCTNLATDVDHILAMADGGEPYDRGNLQALCASHHSQKTAAEVWHRKS